MVDQERQIAVAYKYDPEKLKELQEYVQIGMTDENSAVLAFNIARSTYYEWVGEDSLLQPQEKSDILDTIEKGKAVRNKSLIDEIRNATKSGDGKLALDLLKRLERKDYGDVTRNEQTGKDGGPIETKSETNLSIDERLNKALELLKKLEK